MSAVTKALRSSIRRRRYSMFDDKENDYIHTPRSKRAGSEGCQPAGNVSDPQTTIFRRGSRMTRSVRDAVGTIRQKFRTSTRKRKTPKEKNMPTNVRSSSRSRNQNGGEVALYSPFHIETPGRSAGRVARRSNIRTVVSIETPTRLRREVEALTANMQALSALTPNTLQYGRRKSPLLTNGSLKTPRSARRRIPTNPV